MAIWLAFRNLIHSKARTAVGTAGVTFAVVLLFMQLGFLGSIQSTSSQIFDALEFDLVIRSPDYLHLAAARTIPRQRLREAQSIAGVKTVSPFFIQVNEWSHPDPASNYRNMILTMGVRPSDPVFLLPELQKKTVRLRSSADIMIDRKTKRDFGAANGVAFSNDDIGRSTELGGKRVTIVDHYELGAGFAADGSVVMNEDCFLRVTPGWEREEVSMGFVTVEEEVDPKVVAARIRKTLPASFNANDVEVVPRGRVLKEEREYWMWGTPVGNIFCVGVGIACLVGVVIVYQVLASDVMYRMSEYATMKAIGYTDGTLSCVVICQAVILALMGFLPGWLIANSLYAVTRQITQLPIEMSSERLMSVLSMTICVCVASAIGANRKLRKAAPADLF